MLNTQRSRPGVVGYDGHFRASTEYGLLLSVNHAACEKEEAVITHSLPVTAEIPSRIQTGFIFIFPFLEKK